MRQFLPFFDKRPKKKVVDRSQKSENCEHFVQGDRLEYMYLSPIIWPCLTPNKHATLKRGRSEVGTDGRRLSYPGPRGLEKHILGLILTYYV